MKKFKICSNSDNDFYSLSLLRVLVEEIQEKIENSVNLTYIEIRK